jgi:hypothetical protein
MRFIRRVENVLKFYTFKKGLKKTMKPVKASRCILPGSVAKAQKYIDIPTLRHLARQAPQHLRM